MKKSKFKQLIRGMVFDMLEGKGTAPGSAKGGKGGGSGFGIPGNISKGGFNLQDFSKVLGGFAGRRTKPKRAGGAADRATVRTSKHSLFKGGRDVDQWRLDALKGGSSTGKSKYQTSKSKSKNVSANISSLAAIRKTDYDFIKVAGGRKTQVASGKFKVSSTYINQKSKAISQYASIIDAESAKFTAMVNTIVAGGGTGTIEHQALLNLIEDLALRKAEYTLKWDYATYAYAGNTSGMQNVRNSLETNKNSRLKRSKLVGKGTYSPVVTWSKGGKYNAGDIVTSGKNKYTAIGKGGWGDIDPVSDLKGSVWALNK